MLTYDPRKISVKVYENLKQVKQGTSTTEEHDKQKNQAIELYTYIATWGLMRLAGEEPALSREIQKQRVVRCFFKTLGELAFSGQQSNPLVGEPKIDKLISMTASEYLGLTGLALQVGREFCFWAEALYPKQNSTGTTQTTN
ncbi:MAG: hypothetical protein AAGG00_14005 [Cyanobacteria bacterium P01_H01_bin.150]